MLGLFRSGEISRRQYDFYVVASPLFFSQLMLSLKLGLLDFN